MLRLPKIAQAGRLRTFLVLAAALVAITWLAYANSLSDALSLDDRFFVHPGRTYTSEEVLHFFSEDVWSAGGVTGGLYRPLLLVSLAVDSRIHGTRVWGYHLTNLLLHLAATLLVFFLLLAMLERRGEAKGGPGDGGALLIGAFAGAAVFGVHPIHTEAVDSVFNRSEILSTIAVAGGLLVLLRFERTRPLVAWGAAALLYFVGLLCRESAATFPALAGLSLWFLRCEGDWRRRARRLAPILVLVAPLVVYFLFRSTVMAQSTLDVPDGPAGVRPPLARVAMSLTTLLSSLRMVAWPHPLRVSYEDHVPTLLPLALVVHAGAALAFYFLMRRRREPVALGLLFFYATLAPAQLRLLFGDGMDIPLYERYLYLPSLFLMVPLAEGVRQVVLRAGGGAAVALFAGVVCALAPLTLIRNRQWQSEWELYAADFRASPTNGDAMRLLLGFFENRRDHDKVAALCDRHMKQFPDNQRLVNSCAIAYADRGRDGEAERAYLSVIGKGPIDAVLHANLARLYMKLGRVADAATHFQRSVETEKNPARRHWRKGIYLMRIFGEDRARVLEAKKEFEAALALQPRYGLARQWLQSAEATLAGMK